MRHEFPGGEFFALEVARAGTAGIAYDCQLRVGFSCAGLSGQVLAWCDGPDVEAFVDELAVVGRELKGEASLVSDDGRSLSIRLSPLDTLGHFVLRVQVGADRAFRQRHVEVSCSGAFQLDSQDMTALCVAIGGHITSRLEKLQSTSPEASARRST